MKLQQLSYLFVVSAMMGAEPGVVFGQLGYLQPNQPAAISYMPEGYATFQLNETRAQLGLGVSDLSAQEGHETDPAISLRYRLSPAPWPVSDEKPWHLGPIPLSLSLEGGAMVPAGSSTLASQTITGSNFTDAADSRINYEVYFDLIDELPHGSQTWVIPEIGGGISLISVQTRFNSTASFPENVNGFLIQDSGNDYGTVNETSAHPHFLLGLHFFPEHFISLLVQGSYLFAPNSRTLTINDQSNDSTPNPNPVHVQTFDLPISGWQIQAKAQMKLAWPTLVYRPLLPQLMPPWLLPSYTTEEISPWVAAPEVAHDPRWNRPGQPPVGNVMFQYKNRWAQRVEIIGEFNDWQPEPMLKDRSGIWVSVKDLPAGRFRYNYVVDGKSEIRDPWNRNVDPESRKNGSSIVVVK